MTDALDVAKEALSLWRGVHGSESLYEQCQRYEGYYWQWAYENSDSGVTAYDTAHDSYAASSRYSVSGVNDSTITPGSNLWFDWGSPDHICTAVGWDYANGKRRLLVTNTANGGDCVLDWTNNVKVCHADTIDLPFMGVSHANGSNTKRSNLAPYEINKKAGDDMTVKDIYVAVSRKDPQVVSDRHYLWLDDDKHTSVMAGAVDCAFGVLTLNATPKVLGSEPAATLQVVPYVEEDNPDGSVAKSTSLGMTEFLYTSGSTGFQVSVPPVALGSSGRVRFYIAAVSGGQWTINSGAFRGAEIQNG